MKEPLRWPAGIKRTKQRLLVMEALEGAEKPLTAQELTALLEQKGEGVWLSTVYRVLDTFTEAGLVEKTDGLESGMACYELSSGGHRHYAMCMGCRSVTPLAGCPLERMDEPPDGFQVTGHKVQVFGYCTDCRKKQGK